MNKTELLETARRMRQNKVNPCSAVILALLSDGPQQIGSVSKYLGIKPASLTGTVDFLERKGCIRRFRHGEDRRAVYLQILPLGSKLLDTLLS